MTIITTTKEFELTKEVLGSDNHIYRFRASIVIDYNKKSYKIRHDSILDDSKERYYNVQDEFSKNKLDAIIELLQECKTIGEKEINNL